VGVVEKPTDNNALRCHLSQRKGDSDRPTAQPRSRTGALALLA
jgi:hypothetical protein